MGSLKTNCYLLVDTASKKTLIVDPGDDEEYIKNVIFDNALIPVGIISTHGHFDHNLAAFELQLDFKIPFHLNRGDEFLIRKINESASYFLKRKIQTKIPQIDVDLEKDKDIKMGDLKIKIIKTPGHTPGSICLYLKEEKILFVGDLIFKGGSIGRTDFSYGDKGKLKESLQKIAKLPKEVLVYSGHGEAFNLRDFDFVS